MFSYFFNILKFNNLSKTQRVFKGRVWIYLSWWAQDLSIGTSMYHVIGYLESFNTVFQKYITETHNNMKNYLTQYEANINMQK